ncbi:hypothetical protein [Paracoccus sp. (in: a-proteobacteria)]|uniref:hypothetical protein n=1 Tax=Paracoccus sp. TaxID=267 RepID=UPI002AFF5417|nr:hypothetical protein [Paracoccus sp. (in: a-proteobacteria)]
MTVPQSDAPQSNGFKQIDVTRAARGVIKAGLPVGKVEIDRNGRIVVLIGGPFGSGGKNDWD